MPNDIVIDDTTSAGDLRKAYESMRTRALAAESRLGELEAKDRVTTVAELLKAKGVEGATKAASLYPADGGTDEASVAAWVEDNKDFLRITPPTNPAAPPAPGTPATPGAISTGPDLNQLAAQLVAQATAQGNQGDTFGMQNPQGAPTLDITRMQQIAELMRTAPRTPEGYKTLVDAGIFPANPGM